VFNYFPKSVEESSLDKIERTLQTHYRRRNCHHLIPQLVRRLQASILSINSFRGFGRNSNRFSPFIPEVPTLAKEYEMRFFFNQLLRELVGLLCNGSLVCLFSSRRMASLKKSLETTYPPNTVFGNFCCGNCDGTSSSSIPIDSSCCCCCCSNSIRSSSLRAKARTYASSSSPGGHATKNPCTRKFLNSSTSSVIILASLALFLFCK